MALSRRFYLRRMRIRDKMLIALFGLALPLLTFGTLLALDATRKALERRIDAELNNATAAIVNQVRTAASASIKNYLRAVAEKNRDIAAYIYRVHESGGITQLEAAARIRDVLGSQTVGDTGYIYCIDSGGRATVHPRAAVEGQDYAHFPFVQLQIALKTGYMEYDWKNPEDPAPRPKALYMTYFDPLDWIISVSSYREEFTDLVNVEDFRDDVLAFRFGESGYAFIVDDDGRFLVHPHLDRLERRSAPEEARFFQEMQRRDRGRITYVWQNPGEAAPRQKMVVFERIPEYGWTVAASVYTDEVFEPMEALEQVILAGAVPLGIVLFLMALGISSHLARPIQDLIHTFEQGAEGDFSVRMGQASGWEFERLATYFNGFMQRLDSYRQNLEAEIQERRKAQEELKQSEAHYRLLADNISDVIWMLDMEMRYTYISPSCKQLQGWTVEEFLTMTIHQALTPASVDVAVQAMAEELDAGSRTGNFRRHRTLELELNRSDGRTVWAEITASLLVDPNDRPSGILGVARDISERKAAAAEMHDLQEKLERSKKMEALGLLAGGVAHDLNNVLSGIVSYPDLMLLDLPGDSPLKSPIETIRTSGNKAAAIVQDLLTLARRGVTNTEVLNLNPLVEEVLASPEYRKLLTFHPDIETAVSLETGLPNTMGSSVHLRKSLLNLLSNAMEAQPGGGRLIVRTDSRYLDRPLRGYDTVVDGEYVVLGVQDFGEGIPQEEIPRIFEPFYTKKVMGRSGTGLGMAVVWGTVQDHRGYIDVISEVGKGTTFELYFPLTRREVATDDPTPRPEAYMGHGEALLVVDDVKEQREVATKMLSRLKYNVFTVSSGEKALAFLRTNPVDLVILDMIMDPGMDGLETFQAIRAFLPEQKFIIASGYAETDRVRAAQRAGAGRYLRKPYTLEGIGLAVHEALRSGG